MGLTFSNAYPALGIEPTPSISQTVSWPKLTKREGPAASHAIAVYSSATGCTSYVGLGSGGNFTGPICVAGVGRAIHPWCMCQVCLCVHAWACSCPTALGCSYICYCLCAQLYVAGYTTIGLACTPICGCYQTGRGGYCNFCIPYDCATWKTSGSGYCCWDSYTYGIYVRCPRTVNTSVSVCGCCSRTYSDNRCCKLPMSVIC